MKRILFILLLLPFLGYTQINTFPWTHDFDNGVGLTNWTIDDGDWAIWSGPTYSNLTGPQGDHTTGNGNYWYVESSMPGFPDKVFMSQTDTFDISQTPGQILSFWYHMYGATMGDLNIWLNDDNGPRIIDSIQGDQGDEWHLKYIDLDNLNIVGDFYILFEGITGSSWTSDISIDDLSITDPYPIGCMDPNALNFDPLATVDDGSCAYPPCGGFLTSNAYQMCWSNQTAIQFEWESDTTNSQCDVIEIHVGDENGWSMVFPGYWPASNGLNGHAVAVGNGQMPPNWSLEHYAVLEYADGSLSDTIFYTPTACIPGCTDPTAVSYNPWATSDDGTCGGTNCDPLTEHQITMTIRLDNWPGETSWNMVTNSGPAVNTPQGTYTFNDIGVTYTYNFCVSSTAGFEFIINDSYGDGIMGNGQPGAAGEVVIYDCNGDTITHLTSGTWVDANQNPVGVNFGNVAYSGPQSGVPCAGPPAIPGCMDDDYQEYNPLATIDDSTCVNLHVYGCTDSTAFNYDPNASINDIVPDCNYTLWIGDGAADGWGNSYLGVYQNGVALGTFTMGPGQYQQTFPLILDAGIPVQVYYFEIPNAQNPDPQQTTFQTMQNSFKLINADGVVLMHEGANPFANNGQGALQGFKSPFWVTYSGSPYCGDYCIPAVFGCTDSTAFNYNSLANTDDNSCVPVILGCTNNLAFNYDPLANTDDGSCLPIIVGCMDSTAFNFNPFANIPDPSSCIPVIYGCMDDTMFNYNAAANTDDGSCIPVVFGCTDINAFNYDSLANTNNGSCVPVVLGCTDPTAFNFNQNANTDDGSCVPEVFGCTDSTALNYNATANVNVGCIYPILGCTDPLAFNFDPNANTNDGSCVPVVIGCTDPTALNFDSTANTNSGCIYTILGCTDPTAFNYDINANTDDGSCIPVIIGCTDPVALNFDSTANTNSGCVYPIYGCTDPTMFNYDPLANVDDGSCVPVIIGCIDPTALNYDSTANTNSGCIYPILGCTDPTMFNYDPNANTDDGSCIPFIYGCTDASMFNFDPLANTDNGSCIPFIYGCTDSTQFNYDPTANTDNGSCIPFIYGCTDNTALNFNPLANTLDNSCCYIGGCTDSTALNYNPNACFDDNSCITIVTGCTDVAAYNYNPLANVSDSTACLYDAGCYGGPGIPYWLNDGCYAWVIDVDDYCCNVDWDASCQSMYDYCQLGWPTSVPDISALGIVVYPNPTQNTLTIETRLEIEVEVHDLMGKLLIKTKNINRLDLSDLSNGLYNLSIIHEDKRYNKQIIKQ